MIMRCNLRITGGTIKEEEDYAVMEEEQEKHARNEIAKVRDEGGGGDGDAARREYEVDGRERERVSGGRGSYFAFFCASS